jgi:4-hydroxy-tetrahydrodipicolinate synthase
MTYQRIAAVMRSHPDKLFITGEDRFLGYSIMMGARAALIGMGSALTDIHAALIGTFAARDAHDFMPVSDQLDAFSQVTFIHPMEGYIRRVLWALAADGIIPDDACDDPWGPSLPASQREAVRRFVREARVR